MNLRILRAAVFILVFTLAPQWHAGAQTSDSAIPAHPDRETILHMLNRVGYGPKPGDIDRVRTMGLAAYIDQQLHPEKIADTAVDAALAEFPTLTMSTEALATKYYRPLEKMRKDQQITQAKAAAKIARIRAKK